MTAANSTTTDRVRGWIETLRRLTEFYFQLATVLVLAGLIDAAARAHPEVKQLAFAAKVTIWAVLLWTCLHITPILYRFFSPTRKPKPIELYISWVLAAFMSLFVAVTLISPFSALASGLVK